ncbi:MAG: hypothetical protein M1812_000495 [Candelaria pacifica]|nr:MAG: hypothetical protein M1812_000495 [Candelaria pacifica]
MGTEVAVLSREFPQLDFSTVFSEYPSKTGRWAFSQSAITQRGKDCLRWLKMRPERLIIVTSHSGFLRLGVSHCQYANADYRVFDFEQGDGEELVEREVTEKRGGGMGNSKIGRVFIRPGDFPHDPILKPEGEVTDEAPREP